MTDEEKAKEWVRTNSGYSTKEFHGQKAIEAYLAGAESGYNKAFVEADKNLKAIVTDFNKANEWHYVKDGDLPKIGEKVLSEKGDLVIYKGDGFNWVEYSPNADNIKLRKWEEPRAWKEITPPKEIEEND